jgi:hypothetical protein
MVLYAQPSAIALLPRRLWFQLPSEDEVTWEFPTTHPNVKLNRSDFNPPATRRRIRPRRSADGAARSRIGLAPGGASF